MRPTSSSGRTSKVPAGIQEAPSSPPATHGQANKMTMVASGIGAELAIADDSAAQHGELHQTRFAVLIVIVAKQSVRPASSRRRDRGTDCQTLVLDSELMSLAVDDRSSAG